MFVYFWFLDLNLNILNYKQIIKSCNQCMYYGVRNTCIDETNGKFNISYNLINIPKVMTRC